MTDDDVQALVAPHYMALADLLEKLPPERWDTPSMCAGWRVREVIAHVTMPAHYDEAGFMAELQADGFDFTKLSNRLAERDGQRPTDELVASLRSPVLHSWQPPGGGAQGALTHAVVHGLDVTVPLGEPRASTDEAMRTVLDQLTRQNHFGVDISGKSFAATDLDWSFGDGEPLRGSADDLVLYLASREIPQGRL